MNPARNGPIKIICIKVFFFSFYKALIVVLIINLNQIKVKGCLLNNNETVIVHDEVSNYDNEINIILSISKTNY